MMLSSKKAAAARAPAESTQIWVEKYRPKTLDQVSSQEHTVAVLKKTLLHANMAHLLFYGPPGTGKTSTILALAKELYGPEMFKSRVLELNASDERGIAIVREKVKNFAKTAVTTDRTQGGYPCPPYKIIILDEADSMTQDAQSALRRTMEQYSKITRFCLICNYVTRIIEPLASRCSKFRFKPLDASDTVARLRYIAEQEKVEYEEGVLEALNKTCEGDLRKAITYMQSAAKLHRSLLGGRIDEEGDTTLSLNAKITLASIAEIAGNVPENIVQGLLAACRDRQPFGVLNRLAKEAVAEGYNATQIMSQLHDLVVEDEHVTNKQKNAILMYLSLTDKRLNDGADEHLQILDMLTTMRSLLS